MSNAKTVLFLGRNVGFPVAMEGALKLKELAYIHAEGFAAGELKHGPIALIEQDQPVIVILPSPNDPLHPKVISNIQEIKARGATVIAIAQLGANAPKVRVTAILMCAENALSSTAQRPSDVITHYGGTTVEVINTDAEGRLVLADGLAYADAELDPDYLIDVATLTGAATLGLGRQYAAMYTRDLALAQELYDAGQSSGERVWHMPLIDDYKVALASEVADFNHTAEKPDFNGGSITAALFLEHFAGNRKWVHLDIAGPARSENDSGENPKGGTGFGVRLLTEWLTSL
jgi:leucyl aminopeptidase